MKFDEFGGCQTCFCSIRSTTEERRRRRWLNHAASSEVLSAACCSAQGNPNFSDLML